jgi:uncharacterized membrane protein YbhN (UPF0104 family)
MSFSLRRSALRALWYSFVGVVLLNIGYQAVLGWYQLESLRSAALLPVVMAVLCQFLAYTVLVPAMRGFYHRAGLRLATGRVLALVSVGLGVSRILPAGEYVVWRLGLRRQRGSAGVTTQWYIVYLCAVLLALITLFLVTQLAVLLLYPADQADAIVENLQLLPVVFGFMIGAAVLALRMPAVRRWVAHAAFDQVSTRALSPFGIIREQRLGGRDVGIILAGAFGTWLLEAGALGWCLWALGVQAPWLLILCGFAFARLVANIPFIPGGIGAMEAATAVFFAAYGYPVALVVTATFIYRLISAWLPFVIGVGLFGWLRSDESGSLDLAARPYAGYLHDRN